MKTWVAFAFALALAGCTGPGLRTDPEPVPEPRDRIETLYLTADLKLAAAAPQAGEVPATMRATEQGFGAVAFQGAPLELPTLMPATEWKVTLWVAADAPLASNGNIDAAAWGGTTRGMPLFAGATYSGPVVAPGTPVQLDIVLPRGDMLAPAVPAGEALRLIVGFLGDHGAGTSRILVGGEHASRLEVRLVDLAADPTATDAEPTQQGFEGDLVAFGLVDCGLAPELQVRHHALSLGNGTYLDLALAPTTGGAVDLDLSVRLDGRVVGSAHTPFGEERVLLAGPEFQALAGKTLDLQVSGCHGGHVAYTLTATMG